MQDKNDKKHEDVKSFSEWMRILLTGFFAWLRLFLIVPLGCGILTAAVCMTLPPVYSGGFSILVKAPEVDKTSLESGTSVVVRPGEHMENVISDEIYILQSQDIYRNIARTIETQEVLAGYWSALRIPGWMASPFTGVKKLNAWLKSRRGDTPQKAAVSPVESIAAVVESMSAVQQQVGSDVIEVRLKHHHPQLLRVLLDAYLKAYQNLRDQVWFNKNAVDFFQTRTDEYYEQWQKLFDELLDLKTNWDLTDPAREKVELQKLLMRYMSDIITFETTLKEYESQLQLVKSLSPEESLTFMPERIGVDPLFKDVKMGIAAVKADRSRLLRDFQPQASVVHKMDFQLTDLYHQYQNLLTRYLENQISRTRISLQAASEVLDPTKVRLRDLDRYGQQVALLEQKADLYRKQYAAHGERAMNAQLQKELRKTVSSVEVVSQPFVNPISVWPNKKLLVILSVMLGFLLTGFFTVVMQLMGDSYNLPEEVTQDLDLPVLASIPYNKNHRYR